MSNGASTQALARLEPYLLLASSAKGAAAAKLIDEATSSPGCYVFSELLDLDNIKALVNDQQRVKNLRLLQLFAYGTVRDHAEAPEGHYPPLNAAQQEKLRHLSLLSLAHQSRNLSYETLAGHLGLPWTVTEAGPSNGKVRVDVNQVRHLEDMVIDCIYAGILTGRLDQARQRLEVESVMGRDVPSEGTHVAQLAEKLTAWHTRTASMLEMLAQRIEKARKQDQQRAQRQTESDARIEQTLLALAQRTPNQPGGGGDLIGNRSMYDRMGSDRHGMDVDMDDEAYSLRKKKLSTDGIKRSKRSRA